VAIPLGLGLSPAVPYIPDMSSVRVRVEAGEIIVTDPQTDWRASYRHSKSMNGLIAVQVVTDRAAKVSERSKFLAEAFRKASDRARKLGWMV
jgi:hypothetical protein